MPSKDHNDQESAVIQAAQDSSVENPDTSELAEQNLPDSPRTDGGWEVVEASNRASNCESIPRSLHIDDASARTPDVYDLPAEDCHVCHLHVNPVPQGTSDVSFDLTERAGPASTAAFTALFGQAQQQYQEQLRKAQETLLHQVDSAQDVERQAAADPLKETEAEPPADATKEQALPANAEALVAAEGEGVILEDLPTSTHVPVQADAVDDVEPGSGSASATTSPGPASQPMPGFLVHDPTGELSFMSDGSIIDMQDVVAMDDEVTTAKGKSGDAVSPAVLEELVSEPASPLSQLSQQASEILGVARQLSEDMSEGPHEVTAEAAHAHTAAMEEVEQDDRATPFQRYTDTSGFAAVLHQRLGHLLSTVQAWTASVCGCLPSSAQMYAGTLGVLGCKSPLRHLDGLHWALAGALGLVSAALGLYVMKGHRLQKQVNSNSTELSRLLLKVISLQQSLQSPGRVPIIRHTSSMSTITPFPLIHLL